MTAVGGDEREKERELEKSNVQEQRESNARLHGSPPPHGWLIKLFPRPGAIIRILGHVTFPLFLFFALPLLFSD